MSSTAKSQGTRFHLDNGLVFTRVDGKDGKDAIRIEHVPGKDPLGQPSRAENVIATTSLSGFASVVAALGFDGETAETHTKALDALEKPAPKPDRPETVAARWLREAAGAASIVAGILPTPANIVVRILGAAAGAASVGLDSGLSDEQVIASIRRVTRIDTTEADAKVDALVAAKPSRSDAP